MLASEKVVDVRGPGGTRNRIPHGNIRAKLLNYIGQVFECKAGSPHYSFAQIRLKLAEWCAPSVRSATRVTGETDAGLRSEGRG